MKNAPAACSKDERRFTTLPAGSSRLTAVTGILRLWPCYAFVAAVLASSPAYSAIAYVQGAYSDPSPNESSTTVTFANAQSAGDLNVVVIAWADNSSHVTGITDTVGNSYALAGTAASASGVTQVLYYAKNIGPAAAGANTIHITLDATVESLDARAVEYSGLDTSSPLDQTASAIGNSATASAGPVTTGTANEVIVAGAYTYSAVTGAGTGYSLRILTNPDADSLEDQIVSSTGSYSATAPMTGSNLWAMSLATFRASDSQPPTTPTGLSVTASSSTQINLSWTASTDNVGVTGYKVERCQGSGCSTFTQIGTPTGTTYTDTGLTASTSYSYRVRATDAAGNLSSYSATATATTPANSAIAYVQGAYSDPSPNESSTTVTFANAQSAGDLNVVVIAWADNSSHVTGVTDTVGNSYALAGTAAGASGVTQVLYYAKNIGPAAAGANTIHITFDATVESLDARAVEYSGLDTSSPLDQTASAIGNSATASAGPVTTGTANEVIVAGVYTYSAVMGAGSGYSLRILTNPDADALEDQIVSSTGSYSATAPMTGSNLWAMSLATFRASSGGSGDTQPPTAPTGLSASTAASVANLTWTASTDNVGVTGYYIERCQGAGCTIFTQVGTSSTPSYTDSGLSASTAYSYRVRATDAAGNLSAYSNTASTTTTAGLTPPSGLIVVAASSVEVDLAWNAGSGGSGTISYLIERCSGVSCSSFAQIGAPSGTSYNSGSLVASTSYSYRVRATDTQGDLSPYSNTVSYTTPAATPDCSK